MKSSFKDWEYWWIEWVKPILIAAILALFIRTFAIQPFRIPTSSMYPTLRPGDKMFVSKFAYGVRLPLTMIRLPRLILPQMGDIVVFRSPIEAKKFLVKRYVAGEGDTVSIRDGKIVINGKEVDTAPFNRFFYFNRGKYGLNGETVTVPEGSFFALGDNSANSMDSRYWGFVPYDNLVGKSFVVHWPPSRIHLIGKGD